MSSDYERLIAPLEDRLMRGIWSITQNADDAEEAMQETLEKIWRKWDRIERHPNPQALIMRMAINTAYDAVRRRMRRERRQALAELTLWRHTASPEEKMSRQEEESEIAHAIGNLSRHQSAAVLMRLVQGLSYPEIAETIGCSAATARKHVERGRQRLQGLLRHLAPRGRKGETVT